MMDVLFELLNVNTVMTRRAKCHPDRPHHGLGKCHTCYNRYHYHGYREVLPTYEKWLELQEMGMSLSEAAQRIGIKVDSLKRRIRERRKKGTYSV